MTRVDYYLFSTFSILVLDNGLISSHNLVFNKKNRIIFFVSIIQATEKFKETSETMKVVLKIIMMLFIKETSSDHEE